MLKMRAKSGPKSKIGYTYTKRKYFVQNPKKKKMGTLYFLLDTFFRILTNLLFTKGKYINIMTKILEPGVGILLYCPYRQT